MTIAAILRTKGEEVATIAGDAPLGEAVGELGKRRIGALLVMEGEAVAGILSERDIIYGLAEHGPAVLERPVRNVMSAPAITVERGTDVLAALGLITRRRIRHLPVVEDGALKGIVSIGDLVKFRIERIEAEAEALRSYIQSA